MIVQQPVYGQQMVQQTLMVQQQPMMVAQPMQPQPVMMQQAPMQQMQPMQQPMMVQQAAPVVAVQPVQQQVMVATPGMPPIKLAAGEVWMVLPTVPMGMTIPPGLEYLLPCAGAHVRQKTDIVEVLTNIDTPNKYAIYNDQGQFMYYAKEEQSLGGMIEAQLVGDNRGFHFRVTDGIGRHAFSIHRSSKMWTDCEMVVEAPPGIPVVSSAGPVGHITRKYPGFMKEMFTNCDNFALNFPADLDVRTKCTLLACAIMIDFIDFEDKRDNRTNNRYNNGL